jgi:valyl-tRNA synthetase
MALSKRYDPKAAEPRLQAFWEETGVYRFSPTAGDAVYSIDTPPATVSGHLHLGHAYSYSHADFLARFWRMNGCDVFYPMGYDDNGLPTERLVEKRLGISAAEAGRKAFIEKCLELSQEMERDYEALWRRLGLSIDWRYTYRTVDELARRTSQRSFLDLYRQGLAYRRQAPALWCPECGTAIAQADLDDLERESEFFTLAFRLENGETLPIATTRPELLPACVAVFVHPDDERFRSLVGQQVSVPLSGQKVPLLADAQAEPEKGTGAVMCCTFGDVTDVQWWHTYRLPLVEAIGRDGRMTQAAGDWAGLPVAEARRQTVKALAERGLLLDRRRVAQSVRIHERCDTPIEYVVAQQWFVRVLDFKQELLEAGEQIAWHPDYMKARYLQWVENLNWDWCVSRQRYFGIPFPVWYCSACGQVMVADADQLPVDPTIQPPTRPCDCGSTSFTPELDVMDTWATSSLTPQIVGRWLADEALYDKVFPMSLRPQAHDIIRTWAFYTIVKSHHHFGALPWKDVAVSGWGIAGEGMGKISKSRGGGPMSPVEMIERYSADAVRYWAASTSFGKDAIISEEKVQVGAKLVTKLWNVARFSQRFLEDYHALDRARLSPADRWILARTQRLIRRTTALLRDYDYAAAKSEIEIFFWQDLADNYLEMSKQRLYDETKADRAGARYALYHVLLATVKLFAPFLPHVTEEIYQGLFAVAEGSSSIHRARWPVADETLESNLAEAAGDMLVTLATAVRRYKSDNNLPLGTELGRLQLATAEPTLIETLRAAQDDLMSITRAQRVEVVERLDPALAIVQAEGPVRAALSRS